MKALMKFARQCLGAAALALALPSIASATDGSGPPNILLIVSEDNGQELGCYGDPYAVTPNLDKLAEAGIRFENAFVPQAGCSQSRASFLTGLYPHQHGQIGLTSIFTKSPALTLPANNSLIIDALQTILSTRATTRFS